MAKITLPPVTNSSNLSVLNNNFQEIAEALNDLVLYRDNPDGEPNQLMQDLDFNGNDALNILEARVTNLFINGVKVEPITGVTDTSLKRVNNLSDLADTSAARMNIGLGSVNNTADADKPVSNATQAALDLKADKASPTFTGTVGGITKSMVGLGNVDNTADVNKPVSTATQTALNLKADASAVSNVNNTSDANKPVSTAQQTALNLKADKSGNLSQFAATTSAQLAGVLSDETGTGVFVRNISPALTAPVITGDVSAVAAGAGIVGEAVTNTASGIALTTTTTVNITSISLTAGDWDVTGVVGFTPAGTTVMQIQYGGISTASATLQTFQYFQLNNNNTSAGTGSQFPTPTVRINVSATTTVFLVTQAVFTTSTCTAAGKIVARRVR